MDEIIRYKTQAITARVCEDEAILSFVAQGRAVNVHLHIAALKRLIQQARQELGDQSSPDA